MKKNDLQSKSDTLQEKNQVYKHYKYLENTYTIIYIDWHTNVFNGLYLSNLLVAKELRKTLINILEEMKDSDMITTDSALKQLEYINIHTINLEKIIYN